MVTAGIGHTWNPVVAVMALDRTWNQAVAENPV